MKQKILLKTMLLLCALVAGSTSVWGDEVTFDYSDYKGKGTSSTGSEYTMVKDDVSITETKFYGNTSYAHFYAGGVSTVTPASGVTITEIVLTASGTSYNGYQSSGTITASTGSVSGSTSSTTVTWAGSATSAFTISHNKQIRWTSIVVTYTTSGGGGSTTYTVTYNANGADSGDVPEDNNDYDADDEVTVLGNTGSLTKTGYIFDGWNTAANGSGDAYDAGDTFGISANTTLYAQWTPTPGTGIINFGSASGSTNVSSTSVAGDDSQGNEWTVTTAGTSSFTPNSAYAQIGSGSSPATSITFTTTLPSTANIISFSAKFGGFSGTAGTVTLKVGDTTVGTGSLDATNDVTISNSKAASGTVLTVTVTGISKGVKAYYISYAEGSLVNVTGVTLNKNSTTLSVGMKETLTATIAPTEATNKIVTWKSSDDAVATVVDGEVTAVAEGTATITVTTDDGSFTDDCVVTVTPYVQPTTVTFNITQAMFEGVTFTSNQTTESSISTTVDNVDMTIGKGSSNTYVKDDEFRCYSGGSLTFESPSGFALTQIVFTKGSSWAMNSADSGSLSSQTWETTTNGITSVTFDFTGRTDITKVVVTLAPIVTVTSAGFATYCSPYALDFSSTAIEAYVGTIVGKKLTFTPIYEVPANTGLLLVKAGGATEDIPVIASADPVASCLTGVNEATTLTANDYILNVVDGKAGFYKAGTHTSLAAHRAYIPAALGGEVKAFVFDFDDATGINAIDNGELTIDNAAIFNLAGQRLSKMQKGINIVNGKKILY